MQLCCLTDTQYSLLSTSMGYMYMYGLLDYSTVLLGAGSLAKSERFTIAVVFSV